MATTIAIRFPWGRYHGTPWGRNVNEGVVDWPPEPWRLLRALYATWKARATELSDDVVSSLFDALADPPEYVVPPHRVAHTRHWYPDAKHGPKGGGTDKVFDAFAVMERGAELRVTWPPVLDGPQRTALGVLCERLTYLGRADSICVAALVDAPDVDELPPGYRRLRPAGAERPAGAAPAADGNGVGVAGQHGDDGLGPGRAGRVHEDHAIGEPQLVLAATRPLQMEALEVRPQRLRRSGRLQPPGSQRVPYPVSPEAEVVREPRCRSARRVTAVRLRITGKALPSPRAAVAVAEALRQAALSTFDPVGTGRSSVQLFGKGGDGQRQDTDHRHAHYLALTSRGARRRVLDTLVVWAPDGLEDMEVDALAQVPELRPPLVAADFRLCHVAVEATGSVEEVAPELSGSARRWRSLTPYAPPRNVKRQPTWVDHATAYLLRDLEQAGQPAPLRIEPTREQWLSFRRHRRGEKLADARRAMGFSLEFAQPVEGPISLGALRHFGLGLFVPAER